MTGDLEGFAPEEGSAEAAGASAPELLSLLRRLEWVDYDGWESCKICNGNSGEGLRTEASFIGHIPGCALKAAIDALAAGPRLGAEPSNYTPGQTIKHPTVIDAHLSAYNEILPRDEQSESSKEKD